MELTGTKFEQTLLAISKLVFTKNLQEIVPFLPFPPDTSFVLWVLSAKSVQLLELKAGVLIVSFLLFPAMPLNARFLCLLIAVGRQLPS